MPGWVLNFNRDLLFALLGSISCSMYIDKNYRIGYRKAYSTEKSKIVFLAFALAAPYIPSAPLALC